ncbi:MAG: GNAT family N-acetyltransferase [Actinobacteria bacterium]|nr:GNAT family N-acetyltransferase [Actinomycetota bacterium]
MTQCTSGEVSPQATEGTRGITDETTPPLIEVRPAVTEDLPAVRRIVTAAYAEFEPWLTPANWAVLRSNITTVIESGIPGLLRVAQLDGQLAGTVTYLPPGPKDYRRVPPEWAVIRVLGVDPALRGRGVARALTADCLALAQADHAPAVGLHTAEMMVAARALYEHAGFVHQHDFTHLDLKFSIYMRPM